MPMVGDDLGQIRPDASTPKSEIIPVNQLSARNNIQAFLTSAEKKAWIKTTTLASR
jgi:hypothetical protein